MNDQSQILGVSMRGWIAYTLTIGLVCCVLAKIPIDTQFFTIINSVLVAYVVQASSAKPKDKEDKTESTVSEIK